MSSVSSDDMEQEEMEEERCDDDNDNDVDPLAAMETAERLAVESHLPADVTIEPLPPQPLLGVSYETSQPPDSPPLHPLVGVSCESPSPHSPPPPSPSGEKG